MNTILTDKIVLIGDLHLGVNKNSEEYYRICDDWVDWFLKETTLRKLDCLFVLGDWFHFRDEIPVNAIDYSSLLLERISNSMEVHILTGNHDCFLKDNSSIHSLRQYHQWKNVHVYDELTEIELAGGKRVSVVPWGCPLDKLGKTDYIFGHFEIQNFRWNAFSVCEKGLESSELFKHGVDVYTGHFHKYQSKKYKKGSITYVGSPYQHNFNDVGNINGFHILDVKSGEREFVENRVSPKYEYVKMSNLKHEATEEIIKNNFVKLFIDKEYTEKKVEKTLMDIDKMNPRFLTIEDKSVVKPDLGDLKEEHTVINILDSTKEYIRELKSKNEEKLIERFEEIYVKHAS